LLTNLQILNLARNTLLTGTVPSTFGLLTNLKQLLLQETNLSGPLPFIAANFSGSLLQTGGCVLQFDDCRDYLASSNCFDPIAFCNCVVEPADMSCISIIETLFTQVIGSSVRASSPRTQLSIGITIAIAVASVAIFICLIGVATGWVMRRRRDNAISNDSATKINHYARFVRIFAQQILISHVVRNKYWQVQHRTSCQRRLTVPRVTLLRQLRNCWVVSV
jgi:hypothetical protein